MVLSENWKGLEVFFFFKFHNFYEIAEIIFYENFPPAFFNILKEPLLHSTETNDTSKKCVILSFFELESLREWHYQEGSTPIYLLQKGSEQNVNIIE